MLLGICPDKARANDINPQLINFHRQARDFPVELRKTILNLYGWDSCSKELFLARREEYNEMLENEECSINSAAYFFWLNRHCFNGLYRLNAYGRYNVSWNQEEIMKKSIPSLEEFKAVADVLKKTELSSMDFREFLVDVKEGDMVFLDPPYLPDPNGGDFTSYTKDGFSMQDHQDVVDAARKCLEMGAYVIATNNDSSLTRKMWSGFHFHSYSTSRCICPGRLRVEVAMTGHKADRPIDSIDRFC